MQSQGRPGSFAGEVFIQRLIKGDLFFNAQLPCLMFAAKTQGTPFVTAKLAVITIITRVFFFFISAHAFIVCLVNKFVPLSVINLRITHPHCFESDCRHPLKRLIPRVNVYAN